MRTTKSRTSTIAKMVRFTKSFGIEERTDDGRKLGKITKRKNEEMNAAIREKALNGDMYLYLLGGAFAGNPPKKISRLGNRAIRIANMKKRST